MKYYSCSLLERCRVAKNGNRNGWRLQTLVSFLLLFFVFCVVLPPSARAEEAKQVLFISSYSLDWESVPKQIDGINAEIGNSADMHYLFMYGKDLEPKLAQERAIVSVQTMLKVRPKFDVIIVGDDLALEFALAHREQLFGRTPIVFEGINSKSLAAKASREPGITGVVESFDMENSLAVARSIYPHATRVIGISDDTITGRGTTSQFMDCRAAFPDVQFEVLNTSKLTGEEIKTQLASFAPEKDILFYLVFSEDKDGIRYSAKISTSLVEQYSKVPVFKTDEIGFKYGVLGGKILSYKTMGEATGKMVRSILQGSNPNDMPVTMIPTNYTFNAEALDKYHIPRSKLPANSIIIDNSPSFYEKNKEVLRPLFGIMGILIVVAVLVVLDNLRRRQLNKQLVHAQEELLLSEKSLSAAIKHAELLYWEYYPQSHVALEGLTCQTLLGVPARMGNYPQSLYDRGIIMSEDMPVVTKMYADIDAGVENVTCDARLLQQGVYCWERIRYTVIQRDKQGCPYKVVGTAVSIQREKNMEQRYLDQLNNRKVLGSLSKAYCSINISDNKVMENTGMLEGEYQDYGANADALLTELHKRVMAGNKHQEVLTLTDCASLNKAFAQGNTHFEMELLYAFKLNKPTWVNGILDILENPLTGKLEAFFFLVDIQQQKMKELQYKTHLEEALAAAEKANVAKSEFLSTMSHEIRTPMNVIAGFTGIALAECQDPAIASYLRKITFSNTLLLGIINDVLDMNKLESNKVALQLETVAPREFLSAMQELVEPQMREKHIDFVVEYVDELPAAVKLDKLRCQQIFMNIFSNAAKFTNEYGKVELIVKCLKTDDGKCLITTIAKDNGIGMSPEFQKKLFLPFEQENDVRVSKYTGTGLGMAIVKNLIAIMGGSISVRSTKNVGTEYTIELPLELGNPVDIKEAGAHIGTFETPQFTGKRILLAEDQPLNVEIATRLLRKQGFSVDTVVNGQECLERFEAAAQGYYAAILMDIRMPIMTGLEAAQAIRRLERNDAKAIPIIAMTANAFVTDRDEALAAGMNDHVAKPVEPQVLYNTLAKYIL